MKRYRLLKDLGTCKAGDVFTFVEDGWNYLSYSDPERPSLFLPAELASDPNWFEEILPFKPALDDEFYYIDTTFEVRSNICIISSAALIEAGNCFRTHEQAESCAAVLRAELKKWKEENCA